MCMKNLTIVHTILATSPKKANLTPRKGDKNVSFFNISLFIKILFDLRLDILHKEYTEESIETGFDDQIRENDELGKQN